MKVKSKGELRAVLARILEKSKVHFDFSDGRESDRWNEIIKLSYEALGQPSMAEIGMLLRDEGAKDGRHGEGPSLS